MITPEIHVAAAPKRRFIGLPDHEPDNGECVRHAGNR
jgi:hypothetical protein